ncbi:hypothetical protein RhiJN_11596 [Ceratobasidium sp. AG-Ba]|nr:hypothetical protein RhiJN_11596 [Ceratobasidium sp. AG-Ba]
MYSQTLLVAPTLRVSSPLSPLSVPSICISPAADASLHPETPALEPSSPEVLSPRSVHLLPPPVLSPLRRSLAPSGKVADKQGLDQSTFEQLLVTNRERAAKRSVNAADRLRREVVVKAHQSKQFERRALFLSKIAAPPSPTCADMAVTPPESPAVFHFTLPSPGLASPLELFETVKSRDSWIEHVDYANNCTKRIPGRLPSLDQITARLRRPAVEERLDEVKPRASRLPDTIRASTRVRSTSPPTPAPQVTITPPVPEIAISVPVPEPVKPVVVNQGTHQELAPIGVMSWRDRAAPTPRKDTATTTHTSPRKDTTAARKESWREPESWRKEPTTTVESRRSALARIERTAAQALQLTESERRAVQGRNMLDKLRRRISAPAEMQGAMRRGVPVGGF